MYEHFLFRLICLCLLIPFQNLHAQFIDKVEMRIIHAAFTDSAGANGKNFDIAVLLSCRDTADFPPVLILPPKCSVFENGRERVIMLNAENLSVALYGHTIQEKNKAAFEFVKHHLDVNKLDDQHQMIMYYSLKNIPYTFRHISFSPIVREKRNRAKRIETRLETDVK